MHVDAMTLPLPLSRIGDGARLTLQSGVFATESTCEALPAALAAKYGGIATRVVLYNALMGRKKIARYGEVARQLRG